ncbi:ribosomal-protein-alanine N-acetyltransferase [candidate division WOR-3 bacterium]|uniref:[Ribosomal protein bS18]-alanine N-acetyltransferase n=1 Tax=candidate division WOR-3 bacterium TaxID=2052148 RepID=A0A9D5K902_UNCW3|nr:ribosomal-protein-alanine N-acetyltransferase [candidate division WOR-3 bacterium]MBD3364668.1 ribosomal-protein-alanine N-acetyltransferase [candidate division WOR-3 bacterium]
MFEIREMEPGDLDGICRIECASFSTPWAKVMLAAAMRFSGSLNFVCERDGILAGYVFSRLTGTELHIINTAVEPSMRRQGVGTRLLRFLTDKARDKGALWAYLEVRKNNLAAIRLYQKHGFGIVDTIPGYYEDGSDAYLMAAAVGKRD